MAGYNTFGTGMFESMAFQPPYPQIEDSMFIDPTLESSPLSPYDSLCGQPVQRFPGDAHRTAYFNVDVPMHVPEILTQPRASAAISAVPPASQVRFTSPFSSSEHSSGGGQSPPGETEYTDYDNGPMTPPEMAMFPPYTVPQESYTHSLQFASMGPSYTNGIELQASHQHEYDNESIVDFSMPPRSNSFEGYGANYDPAQGSITPVVSTPPDRVQPAAKKQYPPLPKPHQDDNSESDEDAASQSSKRQNSSDDDDDYRPSKRSKPSGRAPARRLPRGRPPASVAAIGNLNLHSPNSRKRPNKPTVAVTNSPSPRAIPHNSKGFFACADCPKRDFKDRADYDSHVKKQHTRPFPCVFNFAGCDSTFASKNEWKRHVTTQHLLLQYWLCQEGMCAKTCNNNPASAKKGAVIIEDPCSASSSSSNNLPNGAIFNRKDLFTQHLKRMHTPGHVKRLPGHSFKGPFSSNAKTASGDNNSSQTPQEKELIQKWNTRLRTLQERGRRDRCKLPTHMKCPVESCGESPFQGPDAWDQRMEHVAKHLERASSGKEVEVVFGGENDATLVDWASRGDVGIISRKEDGNWELRKPLERTGGRVIVILPGGGAAKEEERVVKHERKMSSIIVRGEEEEEEDDDDDDKMEEGEEDADGEEE